MALEPFTCPICNHATHGPEDIRHGYCPNCHAFTERCWAGLCTGTPAVVLGNIAACRSHAEELGVNVGEGPASAPVGPPSGR